MDVGAYERAAEADTRRADRQEAVAVRGQTSAHSSDRCLRHSPAGAIVREMSPTEQSRTYVLSAAQLSAVQHARAAILHHTGVAVNERVDERHIGEARGSRRVGGSALRHG